MSDNWYVDPVEGEVSYEEIIEKAENGDFHEWNYQAFDFTENGYEDVIGKLKQYSAVEYLGYEEKYKAAVDAGDVAEAAKWKSEMDRMVNEVYDIYRSKNIYPTLYFSEMGIMQEIERCIAYKAFWDGDTVSCVSGDTEYFNGREWKAIENYKFGEMVLQYNDDGSGELVSPLAYIRKADICDFYENMNEWLPMKLTGDHDVVHRTNTGLVKEKFLEIISRAERGESFNIPVSVAMKDNVFSIKATDVLVQAIIEGYLKNRVEYGSMESEFFDYVDDNWIFSDKVFSLIEGQRIEILKGILRVDCPTENIVSDYKKLMSSKSFADALVIVALAHMTAGFGNLMYDWVEPRKSAKGTRLLKVPNITICNYTTEFFDGDDAEDIISSQGIMSYCFNVPSGMLVLRRNGVVFVTGNCGAGIGTTLCKFLFPNLQDTPSKHDLDKAGAESIFAKFNNEAFLKRAIKFCYSYKNGFPVPTAVEGGLRLVGSAPSNFRPMNAKAIYERFCPEGGTIYDFCCVSGDTEYFTGTGWKRIDEYKDGDRVLQFNDDFTANLVFPEEYIHYESDDPFYEYTGMISSCLTGNHDVVYKLKGDNTYHKIKQQDILDGEFSGLIPINCLYKGDETGITAPLSVIRMLVMGFKKGELDNELEEMVYSLSFESRIELIKKLYWGNKRRGETGYYGAIVLPKGSASVLTSLLSLSGMEYMSSTTKSGDKMLISLLKHKGTEWGIWFDNPRDWYSKYNQPRKGFIEVYERHKYCFVVPSHMLVLRRKGRVFITGNCGFGGRMLGALSSQKNFKYIGTDPNTETMYHLHQLGEYIEMVTGREDSYELHCCGSEDFKGKPNSIDFSFSSPPYFDLEVYSDEPTQCYNKFPNLEDWLEGYVRQTIKNIVGMLKPGRCYAVNIADFNVGSGTVAYVDEWIRLSTEEGAPLYDTVYLGVTARAGSKEQAAGELKKENILIFKKPLV